MTSTEPTIQELVREMCRKFGQDVHDAPHKPGAKVRALRRKMATEEHQEYLDAEDADDIYEIIGESADKVIVEYGTIAAAYGVDLDAVIREKIRANMDKVLPDGTTIKDADGKVQPPPGWQRADYTGIVGDPGEWAHSG